MKKLTIILLLLCSALFAQEKRIKVEATNQEWVSFLDKIYNIPGISAKTNDTLRAFIISRASEVQQDTTHTKKSK